MEGNIIPLFFVILSLTATHAHAALGEAEWSLDTDQQALRAGAHREMRLRSGGASHGYRVHEIVSDSVTVREYVGQDGVVFGLAWKGMIHPDLSQLLGRFGDDYAQARVAQQRRSQQRGVVRMRGAQRSVRGSQVVVQKYGHMRALAGRAYVPALLPPGMRANEIR
jgi:hypothetical protein